MVNRPIIYAQEQERSYDILSLARDVLYSLGEQIGDGLGSTITVVSGLAATQDTPADLGVNIAAGRIYQIAEIDATAYGTLGQDTDTTYQQGFSAAQKLTLSTSGLAAGQSRWALIQAIFTQTDVIPSDDPNNGVLNYWNISNPSVPLVGPGGSGTPQNTSRTGVCTLSVIYGAVATTGSEVPPNPSANNVPLYLIDLAYGQTQITNAEILVAGPSIGTNVPSNYPQAPFLAGLLSSHHNGKAGQAPKVSLTGEVQGILPLANLPASSAVSGGGVATCYSYAGNPNGHVAGNAGSSGVSPPDLCVDTTTGVLFVCLTTGTSLTAVWAESNAPFYWGGTSTGSANAQAIAPATPAADLFDGMQVAFIAGYTNTGAMTLVVSGLTAESVVRYDGTATKSNDVVVGSLVRATYHLSATAFYLDSITLPQIQSQQTNYAADTGSANAYVAAFTPPLSAYVVGMTMRVKIANTNTGASTFNGGPSAISIINSDGSALTGSELIAGAIVEFVYDGTNIQYSVQTRVATATEATALTAPEVFLSPANLGALMPQSLGTSGHVQLPGGLIAQWDTVAVTVTSTDHVVQAITFPEAFTTVCYGVVTTCQENGAFNPAVAGANWVAIAYGFSTTGANIRVDTESGGTPTGTVHVFYLAIGK